MEERYINVKGMSCNHCTMTVKEAVSSLNGVEEVTVSLEDGRVYVKFDLDLLPVEAIIKAIEKSGYKAEVHDS